MKAAIFHAPHEPLTIEDVEIDAPMAREILVRTVASGVCHSDLHFVDGLYPMAAPAILGHEAAGIVEAVGDQVTYVKPGDHVIACLSVFCGSCEQCIDRPPEPLHQPRQPARAQPAAEAQPGRLARLPVREHRELRREDAAARERRREDPRGHPARPAPRSSAAAS